MTFKEYIVKQLGEKAKENKKKILFVDGTDERAVEAAKMHQAESYLEPVILVRTESERPAGINSVIVIEEWKDREEALVEAYLNKRKGKETREQAIKAIWERSNFAMLMIELGEVDGVIGGLEDPTSVILRSAFKLIGPQQGTKTISSIMIVEKGQDWYIFGDISVNITPTKDQLVDIAINARNFARTFGIEEKIAFLSYSTEGSAVAEESIRVKEATDAFNEITDGTKAIGEVQFDAAISEKVRKLKYSKESFSGSPMIFIFPSLSAGNIGYKIAQRMAGFGAIGPILTGVSKPVNDLSRGSEVTDVYNTALVTALQSYE